MDGNVSPFKRHDHQYLCGQCMFLHALSSYSDDDDIFGISLSGLMVDVICLHQQI